MDTFCIIEDRFVLVAARLHEKAETSAITGENWQKRFRSPAKQPAPVGRVSSHGGGACEICGLASRRTLSQPQTAQDTGARGTKAMQHENDKKPAKNDLDVAIEHGKIPQNACNPKTDSP